MLHRVRRTALAVLCAAAGPALAQAAAPPDPLTDTLAAAAPALDREVLALATQALACAARHAGTAPRTLGVIDYSQPSTQPRLWVFDLHAQRLLFEEWVAHGRNTGQDRATRFSNQDGSYMSSLGGFLTEEPYVGHNGYSLRLRGLEPGFNDRARERAIVIHGAPYVSQDLIRSQGRLGRSLGCPAVRPAIARALIDTIRDGAFLFAYYPDPAWLAGSPLLAPDCGEPDARLAAHGTGARHAAAN